MTQLDIDFSQMFDSEDVSICLNALYEAGVQDDTLALIYEANYKVHKQTKHNEIPPVRAIVSGSGSITENISIFLEYHIKEMSMKHQSYLQDTPFF